MDSPYTISFWTVGVLEQAITGLDAQDALTIFTSTDVKGALIPKDDEMPRLATRHQAALRFFQTVEDRDDLTQCVAVIEPEDIRNEFDLAFRRLAQSLDMMLPDPRALPFVDDLKWLGRIRQAAKAKYRDGKLDISDCGAKVKQLIEDAIVADGIQILVKEVPLFSVEFEEKLAALKSDDARASEIEHAIRHEIHVHLDENPAFYESLKKRLEKIIEDRKADRISQAEQLLRHDAEAPHEAAAALGLDEGSFAIYGLLEKTLPVRTKDVDTTGYTAQANQDLASLLGDAIDPLTQNVGWTQKEDVQREMRKKIKKILRVAKVEGADVNALAQDIVDLAKVRYKK